MRRGHGGLEDITALNPVEWLRTEFRAFSVPRKRRNSDGMNQNFRLFRVPRNNFFLGKWQPLSCGCVRGGWLYRQILPSRPHERTPGGGGGGGVASLAYLWSLESQIMTF
jgi:hypothetical protein